MCSEGLTAPDNYPSNQLRFLLYKTSVGAFSQRSVINQSITLNQLPKSLQHSLFPLLLSVLRRGYTRDVGNVFEILLLIAACCDITITSPDGLKLQQVSNTN